MALNLEEYRSGEDMNGFQYQFFLPSHINDRWTWDTPQINQLVEKAAIRLGELNSYARLVPNIDLFIQLHVTKEAVVSSRIEGTKTNIDEALRKAFAATVGADHVFRTDAVSLIGDPVAHRGDHAVRVLAVAQIFGLEAGDGA